MIRTALSLILLTTAAPVLAGGPTTNLPYTIARRAAPLGNTSVTLPAGVVIDLTTWNTTQERSRLPVNRLTGYTDILVNPNGTAVLSTIYSVPTATSLGGTFLHFWVAERADVVGPAGIVAPTLPLPPNPANPQPARFNGLALNGEYRLVTLFTRTGLVTSYGSMPFDWAHVGNVPPFAPANPQYSPGLPFAATQQGMNR